MLAVFDIDGTLVRWKSHRYVWDFLIEDAGLREWNRGARAAYCSGALAYEDWHAQLFELWKASNIRREVLERRLLDNLLPFDVSQVLNVIRLFPHRAILSGSVSLALDVADIPRELFGCIYAHELEFDPTTGLMTDSQVCPYGSDADKILGLRCLQQHYGLPVDKVLFVGDSQNDLMLINWLNSAGGVGFAIPPLADTPADLLRPDRRGILSDIGRFS